MKTLVSFPSYGREATYALAAGAPDAEFPIGNVADLDEMRRVCKATGAVVITGVLPASQVLRFVSLLHHNAAGATMVVKLYSDAAMAVLIHTSAAIAVNDGDGLYPPCTPYLFDALTVRAVRIELAAGAWTFGGVEISGAWEFQDVHVEREFGFDNRDSVTELADGVEFVTKNWSPRTLVATRMIDVTEEETTALDFQMEKGSDRPFVVVLDYDDPATWDRGCFVVRDVALSPLTKNQHPSALVRFGLEEHM